MSANGFEIKNTKEEPNKDLVNLSFNYQNVSNINYEKFKKAVGNKDGKSKIIIFII